LILLFLVNFYHAQPNQIIRKEVLQNIESNQQLTAKVEIQLQGVMNEFALSLKKEIAANY
jgi:hypothetical protein